MYLGSCGLMLTILVTSHFTVIEIQLFIYRYVATELICVNMSGPEIPLVHRFQLKTSWLGINITWFTFCILQEHENYNKLKERLLEDNISNHQNSSLNENKQKNFQYVNQSALNIDEVISCKEEIDVSMF